LGFKENILKFKRETFLGWHNKFYNPNNLIVSVVGSADFSNILKVSEKFFKKSGNEEMPAINLVPRNSNFIEKRKHIDQAHLGFLFHVPNLRNKKRYSCDVMNAILGEGMSSRLFQEIREKRGLAYTIKSFVEQERDYGHCLVYAGVEKLNLKKTKELVLKELKGMKNLNSREIEQAKEQCIGRWNVQNEQSDAMAVQLFMQEMATRAEEIYEYPEKISSVKIGDVKDLMKLKGLSQGMIIPG